MDFARFARIETERLSLCQMADVDPADLAAKINDFEIARWLTRVPHPYRLADAQSFIAARSKAPCATWAIFDASGLVGAVALDKHLGYWLIRDAWGKGYATEAARAVIAAHFADADAGSLGSSYFLGNDASKTVLSKLGFVETGTCCLHSVSQGRDVDGIEMELTRRAYEAQPYPVIRTSRLVLDRLTDDDWPVVHSEWGDPAIARMTATVKANWTAQEARDWMANRRGVGSAIRLPDGTLIGSVGMGGDPANIGYMLGRRYWGQGYATEAVGAFIAAAFERRQDLREIQAGVFDDNPGSAGVLRKLGFERIGVGDCSSLSRLEPAANSEYRLSRSTFEAST